MKRARYTDRTCFTTLCESQSQKIKEFRTNHAVILTDPMSLSYRVRGDFRHVNTGHVTYDCESYAKGLDT
jgi:hypothetical protein